MSASTKKAASPLLVVVAFAIVYVVWGSTYFFIQKAIEHIPALLMGAFRFIAAGVLLMGWCLIKQEQLWNWQQIKSAAITGLLLLFIGNGAVIWAEKSLPSSLVAVLLSSSPIWFVILDKPKWKENFTNREIILGLIVGFAGVILLFKTQLATALSESGNAAQIFGLAILLIGSMSWAAGSLYSKYKSSGSATVNTAWQMLAAGIAFMVASLSNNEVSGFDLREVTIGSWLSLLYLIFMGSLAGYSAYVWLLQVRPVTQVSTYAYVNPVVAVLLGAFLAGEQITLPQIVGLAVILISVLLINLSKYRGKRKTQEMIKSTPKGRTKIISTTKDKAVFTEV